MKMKNKPLSFLMALAWHLSDNTIQKKFVYYQSQEKLFFPPNRQHKIHGQLDYKVSSWPSSK